MTRRDNNQNEHMRGTKDWCKLPRKTTEVVRPCEENERGAHSEKNARHGHKIAKKKWAAKPKMERGV